MSEARSWCGWMRGVWRPRLTSRAGLWCWSLRATRARGWAFGLGQDGTAVEDLGGDLAAAVAALMERTGGGGRAAWGRGEEAGMSIPGVEVDTVTAPVLSAELLAKLEHVRSMLAREMLATPGAEDVCLTCSFQAEDVLLLWLARELRPEIPVLFLDTGYHFAETYAYRDRMAAEWELNLTNLQPEKTVAEQEAEFGLLHQIAPDRCCGLRKVEPLFKAVGEYKVMADRAAAGAGEKPRGRWRRSRTSRCRAAGRC